MRALVATSHADYDTEHMSFLIVLILGLVSFLSLYLRVVLPVFSFILSGERFDSIRFSAGKNIQSDVSVYELLYVERSGITRGID